MASRPGHGLFSVAIAAGMVLGITPVHADPERAPAGDSAQPVRRARAVSMPSLRGRTLTPGRDRDAQSLEDALIEELRRLEAEPPLRRGTTAIYVVDAATGRPLYSMHEDEPLNPASNVKLISTATALDVLGPDWRYVTRVLGPAPGPDGVLDGDVYLLGTYDPTLHGAHLAELAGALARAGVTRIDGDVVVGPEDARDSLGLPRIQLHVQGTQPGEAPEVRVEIAGQDLPDEALADMLELHVRATTIRRRRRSRIQVQVALIEGPSPRYRVEVTGTISRRRRARIRRRVPAPQVLTAKLLRASLVQAGVAVQGSVRRSELVAYVAETTAARGLPIELARHESSSLSALVARINKRSLNRLADRVIMTAGAALYGGVPTMDKGVRAMHAWLREHAGIDPEGLLLDTGSGLSYNTELTARQIVRVLRAASGMWARQTPDVTKPGAPEERLPPMLASAAGALGAGPAAAPEVALAGMLDEDTAQDFGHEAGDGPQPIDDASVAGGDQVLDSLQTLQDVFLGSLAVGGVDGTLHHRFRELRGAVRAKTGTLTKVIALSGLVSHGDDALAFAIVTNGNNHRKRNRVRRQHEEIVEALHRYLRRRAEAAE